MKNKKQVINLVANKIMAAINSYTEEGYTIESAAKKVGEEMNALVEAHKGSNYNAEQIEAAMSDYFKKFDSIYRPDPDMPDGMGESDL